MTRDLIASAFEYTYPLYAFASTRYRAVADESNPRRHGLNSLLHEKHLSDHTSRWITAPNNDTLYSNAWLDLSGGPVRVRVRSMAEGRYWSVALLDAYTNNFAMLGQRLDGCGPVDVTLTGPGQTAPAGAGRVIHAPGCDVWLFARMLVDAPSDLVNAHAMQGNVDVWSTSPVAAREFVVPGPATDPVRYLAVVNELLGRNPPPAAQRKLIQGWHDIGIRPGEKQVWNRLSDQVRQSWSGHIQSVFDELRLAGVRGRRNIQGWITSGPEIGNFLDNFALRASVALGGLGALEQVEAAYFVKFHDRELQLLHGGNRYVLRVPPSGIPTDSFWSFSIYAPTADGKRYFVDNPIQRFAIGNRTKGLSFHADGSLEISLQNHAPQDRRTLANWLPTPEGEFQIALRVYLPKEALRAGTTEMPTVVEIG